MRVQGSPDFSTVLPLLAKIVGREVRAGTVSGMHSERIAIGGLEITLSVDARPLNGLEKNIAEELLDLALREAASRIQTDLVEQRLQLIERENSELILKNRALNDFSLRDPLTGLFNRWHLIEQIDAEMNRSFRFGVPLAVMMIDLDQFRRINERFGESVGDRLLHAIGQNLRENCRIYDVASRFGGEEFCLLLPQTRLEHAAPIAERIRLRIEATTMSQLDASIRVTASIGIASLENVPDESIFGAAALIERADRALDAAKDGGRNRVETWSSAMANRPMPAFEH